MAVRLAEVYVHEIHSAKYHVLELCTTHHYPITEYHTEWKDGTI